VLAQNADTPALPDGQAVDGDAVPGEGVLTAVPTVGQAENTTELAVVSLSALPVPKRNPVVLMKEALKGALVARDGVEQYLRAQPEAAVNQMLWLADLDDDLYELGRQVLRRHWINLGAWRAIRLAAQDGLTRLADTAAEVSISAASSQEDTALGWWWYLDEPSFERSARIDWWRLLSFLIGVVLPFGLLLFFLEPIVSTARTFSNFVLTQFAGVDTSQLGLDLFTIGTIAVQILFGGRLSLGFARQVTDSLNRILQGWRFPFRRVLVGLLPISPFLVGTLTFLLIVLIINIILFPQLYGILQRQAQTAEELDAASLLARNTEDPFSLTSLGIRFEQSGNFEQAQRRYEQALASDDQLIFARYRLAALLIDLGEFDDAIRYLDTGLEQLEDYITMQPDASPGASLPLDNKGQAKQLKYLFLVSRGRAFLGKDAPDAALIDFGTITRMLREPDALELFVTLENKDTAPDNAQSALEHYYYLAQTYDALLLSDSLNEAQRVQYTLGAEEAWDTVRRLANFEIGRERLWLLEANERLRPPVPTAPAD
jgi:tetratricopeptide (TPR) repeat protein